MFGRLFGSGLLATLKSGLRHGILNSANLRLVSFVVNLERRFIPTREEWDATLREHGIDLTFADRFDPANYWRERSIAAEYEGVHCTFVLGFSNLTAEDKTDRPETVGCDCCAVFRWDGESIADASAAMLAAGTLALVADGRIHWQRAQGGMARREHAYKLIRSHVTRELDRITKAPEFKARRVGDAAEVLTYNGDWLKCPRCFRAFSQSDPRAWDGEKHRCCGQKIVARRQTRSRRWWPLGSH